MDHDLKLTITETMDAPPSAVWQTLTDPKLIKQYFFGTEVETDWREGSPITFKGEWEGRQYLDKGTILEIEKEKCIKYSYWSSMSGLEDKPENYATVTYELKADNSQTIVTVTQEGFRDREAYEHSTQGWKEVLKKLARVLVNESGSGT